MPYAVSTPSLRFSFVKGWLTGGTDPADGSVECGEGTAYPLKVTRDQLAELFYRVRDARFSGSVSANYGFTTITLIADATTAPPSDFHSGTISDVICQRSYVTDDPPVNVDDERKIWTADLVEPAPPAETISVRPQVHGIVTGLTHYLESFAVPSSDYHVRGETEGAEEFPWLAVIELAFGGQVAWVDVNESSNPFDPANELWVGMGFACYTYDGSQAIVDAYTLREFSSNEGESGELTIALQTGNVTCQLYCSNFAFLSSAYSDLTLTPKGWFPYAKGVPASPVWDSANGVRL
jgi:hypothetical protein